MPYYETSWAADISRPQSKNKVDQLWRSWFKSPTWKEANKDEVSPGCKTALETTGGGRGRIKQLPVRCLIEA